MRRTRSSDAPCSFPQSARVKRRADFLRTLRRGARAADGVLLMRALPNDRARTRLGLIVARAHGNAVARNRIKRMLRESFRLCRCELPKGLDLICTPARRVPTDIELQSAIQSMLRLTRKLARRLARDGSDGGYNAGS